MPSTIFAPQGGEVQVNTYTASSQYYPSVTGLGDGGYVVTWTSENQDGFGWGIYAQRYDASGVPQGGEVQVNTFTTFDQYLPSVAALPDGGYVVAWMSENQDGYGWGIYAQRYDASGVPQGGEVQVSTAASNQYFPSVTGLAHGGYVVTWMSQDQDGSGWGTYAQRYDASGIAQGVEVQVNTYTASNQFYPSVTGLADGGYVITWASNGQDGSGQGIYAQRYDAAGTAVGGEVQVNTYTDSDQNEPSVTALADGSYVITWASNGQDGSGHGVYAQRYDAAGTAIGGEVQINTFTASNQDSPSVTALADGGYVITWASNGQDGSGHGVYAQRYDAAGTAIGGEVQINTFTTFDQYLPSVAALPDGGYVVAWMSDGQDGGGFGIYSQRYGPIVITGTAGDDFIVGTPGDDQINGLAGNDLILGSGGNDQLNGGDGDDTLEGNTGIDSFDGGAGFDRVSLHEEEATQAVIADLRTQTITNDGYGNSETMTSIEALGGGTRFADTFYGDDNRNLLVGSTGDTLYGFGGDDSFIIDGAPALLDGGGGSNSIDLFRQVRLIDLNGDGIGEMEATTNGVHVDLSIGRIVNDGFGGSGDIINIQNLGGSAGDDIFYGDDVDNQLFGAGGNDLIDGAGGDDSLSGDQGDDLIFGGVGNDIVGGGDGDDVLDGGEGNDFLDGGLGNNRLDGGSGNDELHGNVGQDVLTGGAGDDVLIDFEGNDSLDGGDGNDYLDGGAGDDLLVGGDGDDSLNDASGNNTLYGGSGNDFLGAGGGNDVLYGGDGDDTVTGGDGTNSLDGGNGNDWLLGGSGASTIIGGAGDDLVSGGSGDETITGGTGDDDVDGGAGNDSISGDEGNDAISGGAGDDLIAGGAGNDFLLGATGTDTLIGGDGYDNLNGQQGNDVLIGEAGNDFLRIGSGNDVADGGAGFDRVSYYANATTGGVSVSLMLQGAPQFTGQSTDTLIGIEALTGTRFDDHLTGDNNANWLMAIGGNDTLVGNGGDDLLGAWSVGNHSLNGGAGVDTVSFTEGASGPGVQTIIAGVTASLALQGAAQATGAGLMILTSIENLSGTSFNDQLTGDGGANILAGGAGGDTLFGGGGNDTLYGDGLIQADFAASGGASGPITLFDNIASGNDRLDGGKGDDVLFGGGGDDVLTGGSGIDRFIFGPGSGQDHITDYTKGEVIAINGVSGVTAFSNLTITTVGGSAVISWGTGDTLTLDGYRGSKLSAADFVFGPSVATAFAGADYGSPVSETELGILGGAANSAIDHWLV